MNNNKQIIMGVLGILSLILITVGVTYAVFNYTKLGTTENTITSGTLKFLYTENTGVGNGISITNALPVSDEIGKNYATEGYVFDFKVESTNSGTEAINYEVTLRKKKTSTLIDDAVKIYLTDMTSNTDTSIIEPTLFSNLTNTTIDVGDNVEKTLYNGTVPGGDLTYLKNFRLRMWIDDKADFSSGELNDKSFTATVNVYANANVVSESNVYKEALLNGTDPVLKDNLIPVKIANNGTVTKADINTEWYNYENKVWANAIILKDKSINYNNGSVIPEENIESYFVWIPKYNYELWDLGNYNSLTSSDNTKVHTIPVRFGISNTSDTNSGECTTPGTSGESGNCKIGDYMTHPAFQSFDSIGFWVGKFETGYDGASSTSEAVVNSSDSSKIIVKPDVYSWRGIQVANAFTASYNYQRNLDSHMMKNTEWGAVVYLSHSSYGINNKININNNSSYKTGYSALPSTNQLSFPGVYGDGTNYNSSYNNEVGYLASTTGNITGIYDMSGLSQEYVASYLKGQVGNSGFNQSTISNYDSKYFDVYDELNNGTSYNYRILGDATGEMGPFENYTDDDGKNRFHNSWYKSLSIFINPSYSWIIRGTSYSHGILAGQFSFNTADGITHSNVSSRIVLTPTK